MKFFAKSTLLSVLFVEALTAGTVTSTLNLSGSPTSMAVSGTTGVVAIASGSIANLFDLTTGQITGTVNFGTDSNLAVALSGTTGAASFSTQPYFRTFDTTTAQILPNGTAAAYPPRATPLGLVISGTTAWYSENSPSFVDEFDVTTSGYIIDWSISTFIHGGNSAIAADQFTLISENSGTNELGFFSLNRGTGSSLPFLGTLSVGQSPAGLFFTGTTGVVANTASNNVNLFDVSTRLISSTIPVGGSPFGVSVSSGKLAVANQGSNNISIVDLSSAQIVDTVNVGNSPKFVGLYQNYGVAVNAGDNTLTFFTTGSTPPPPPISGTYTWTGTVSNLWTNGGNWDSTVSPSSSNPAVLNTGGTAIQLNTAVAQSLLITGASDFILGTGSLALSDASAPLTVNGGTQVINAPLTLNLGGPIAVNSATLSFLGPVSSNSNSVSVLGNGQVIVGPSGELGQNAAYMAINMPSGSIINNNRIGNVYVAQDSNIEVFSGNIVNNKRLGDFSSGARGTLSILGGTIVTTDGLGVYFTPSTGTVVISGGSISNIGSGSFSAEIGSQASNVTISGSSYINNQGGANEARIGFNSSSIIIGGNAVLNNLNGSSSIGRIQTGSSQIQITGGQVFNAGDFADFENASLGTVGVTGGNIVNTSRFAEFVPSASGTVVISGGSISNLSSSSVAELAFNPQSLTINGTSFINNQAGSALARIGYNAKNFTIGGNAVINNLSSNSFVGFFDSTTATMNITGGTINIGGGFVCNVRGTSNVSVNISNNPSVSTFNGGGFCDTDFGSRNNSTVSITVGGGRFTNGAFGAGQGGMFNGPDFVTINGGSFTNYDYMLGDAIRGTINGGSISNISSGATSAKVAENTDSIALTGSSKFYNSGLPAALAYLGRGATNLAISSNALVSNIGTASVVGPAQLSMIGGQLNSDGYILLDNITDLYSQSPSRLPGTSTISSGSITGSGEMWVAGRLDLTTPVTQSVIRVGQGVQVPEVEPTTSTNASAVLSASTLVNAGVVVTGSGSLLAKGTITGSVTCAGNFSPGITTTPSGVLNVGSRVSLSGPSNFFAVIDGALSNRLVASGTLSLGGSTSLIISKTSAAVTGNNTYTIAQAPAITGFFGTVIDGSGLGSALSVVYNPTSIQLVVTGTTTPTPPPTPSSNSNAASVVNTLISINGNCPQDTQNIINYIFTLPPAQQIEAIDQLEPAMKTIQFSLEKLDLLIHKELESALYSDKEGTVPFIIAGYDNLDQGVHKAYNGYSIDSYYQLFGVTHDWKGANWMAMIGASESYMAVRPQAARASYNTVWAALGGSGNHHRWHYGLDTLFGYSFTKSHRDISFLGDQAHSNHGAWNISFDGKLGYEFTNRIFDAMIYDDVSYIYGRENDYSESGAPGANLHVKDENISQIRNMLGLSFETKQCKALRFFADGSWVYEQYFNNNTYYAAFLGTSVYGPYKQQEPAQNYGRIHTGLKGDYKDFDWKLSYTGLFGKKFSESSASVKFGYKF